MKKKSKKFLICDLINELVGVIQDYFMSHPLRDHSHGLLNGDEKDGEFFAQVFAKVILNNDFACIDGIEVFEKAKKIYQKVRDKE
jgi:hypothetical protein